MWSRWSFWKHSFAFFIHPSIPPSLTHSINVTMMNQWSEIGSIRTALLRLMLAKIIKEYQSNKNVSLLRFLTYDKNCDCKRSICGSRARFLSHVDNETFIIIASTFKIRLSLRWKACHCEDFFPPCIFFLMLLVSYRMTETTTFNPWMQSATISPWESWRRCRSFK